jgi:hypothetical protein
LSFNLVFDVLLAKNNVNRRGASEEGKRGNVLGHRRRDRRLNDRNHGCNMQQNRRRGYLHAYMGNRAERAVSVGDVSHGMSMDSLNRAAGNDQRDAQQREEKSPRVLRIRS